MRDVRETQKGPRLRAARASPAWNRWREAVGGTVLCRERGLRVPRRGPAFENLYSAIHESWATRAIIRGRYTE